MNADFSLATGGGITRRRDDAKPLLRGIFGVRCLGSRVRAKRAAEATPPPAPAPVKHTNSGGCVLARNGGAGVPPPEGQALRRHYEQCQIQGFQINFFAQKSLS